MLTFRMMAAMGAFVALLAALWSIAEHWYREYTRPAGRTLPEWRG